MPGLSRSRLLLPAAALVLTAGLVIACGGGGEDEGLAHYEFIRVRDGVIRIDTRTGELSSALDSGDGGWTPLGRSPTAGEPAGASGRYRIHTLAVRGRPQRGSQVEDLLLFDAERGRTWLGRNDPDTEWLPIAEPGGAAIVAERAADRPAQTSAPAESVPPEQVEYPVLSADQLSQSPEQAGQNLEVLLQVLEKEGLPTNMKVWAIRQLAEFDKEVAVPPLLETLSHEDPELVAAAVEALGKVREPSTIPKILALAQHPDPRVRAAVESVVVEVR